MSRPVVIGCAFVAMLCGLSLSTANPSYASEGPIYEGLVFVDGDWLPRPYHVTADASGVFINDQLIVPMPQGDADTTPNARWRRMGDHFGRMRNYPMRFRPSPERHAQRLADSLLNNTIVVAYSGRPLIKLQGSSQEYDFLHAIMKPKNSAEQSARLLDQFRDDETRQIWRAWLSNFSAPAALRPIAQSRLDHYDAIEADNQRRVDANVRLSAVSYPLTVFGMALCALALGHLLRSAANPSSGEGASPKLVRATLFSLGLIAVMSTCDLVWTILAHQAGQMKELNPLGSRLVEDPLSLIAFKAALTILSCGILWALRQKPTAQFASWWMCLVSTLLMFRWIVFNSMFAGTV